MKRRTTEQLEKNLNSDRYSTEEKNQIKGILEGREKKRKEISSILEKNQPKKETKESNPSKVLISPTQHPSLINRECLASNSLIASSKLLFVRLISVIFHSCTLSKPSLQDPKLS